jgi:hypothetical protein
MAELSFRQKAQQQAAVDLRARLTQGDARQPFTAAIGTISIALRVCVGRPRYIGPDGIEQQAECDQIVVVLAMSNAQGAAPMRYLGWSNSGEEPLGSGHVVLSDNAGNQYTRATTSRGLERWVGQVSGSRSVGPGETLADVLVFSPPQPKATKFTLELPRANWGMSGTLRIELAMGRIANFPQLAV